MLFCLLFLQICYAANGNAVKLSCELLRNFVTGFYTNFWLLNWEDCVLILVCVYCDILRKQFVLRQRLCSALLQLLKQRVWVRLKQLTWSGFSHNCFWIFEVLKRIFFFFVSVLLLLFCFSYPYNLNPWEYDFFGK